MNRKMTLAFLIVVAATMFSAFKGKDKMEASATLLCVTPSTAETQPGKSKLTNIMLQSKDAGQTWEDISYGLPEEGQPVDFFAGEAELFLHLKSGMYRSKSNLRTPVWVKERTVDPRSTLIAFNRSGLLAYNYEGHMYQMVPTIGSWSPLDPIFKAGSMRTIHETADGNIFIGADQGLYKSADGGRSWRQVLNEGVMHLVETAGVLLATSQAGIIRSTDNGEHWAPVISEGGVGIAVERIEGGIAAIVYSSTAISRRIYASFDAGKTWTAIDEGLRPAMSISSIKQVGHYLICGHPDGIFRSADMGKTWSLVCSSADNWPKFSSDGKVFKVYASGGVLYAVARDSGC